MTTTEIGLNVQLLQDLKQKYPEVAEHVITLCVRQVHVLFFYHYRQHSKLCTFLYISYVMYVRPKIRLKLFDIALR